MSKILTLHLKEKYFNQIKSGEKTEEYRVITKYWRSRLYNPELKFVQIMLGYPQANDIVKQILFPWNGFEIKTITHELFGKTPVKVFVIKLRKE